MIGERVQGSETKGTRVGVMNYDSRTFQLRSQLDISILPWLLAPGPWLFLRASSFSLRVLGDSVVKSEVSKNRCYTFHHHRLR